MPVKLPKVLLITLKTFSMTGGVEKVCRGLGYALQQMHEANEVRFKLISIYDTETDERYVKKKNFNGYAGYRGKGMLAAIKEGICYNTVILSHINLAPIGLAIKLASPSTRLILWTHGIEVWRPINPVKKLFLTRADELVAVSEFTAKEIERMHDTGGKKVKIVPNALDPYFEIPHLGKPNPQGADGNILYLLKEQNNIKDGIKVFMALTRLRGTEKNKNYDKVIQLLGELKKEGKEAYYILCGKYDDEEYVRIRSIATRADMAENVILVGFITDEELSAYYQLADAFVLPSTKEGFGLAFIEAQACGLPVLAGNQDGSIEAVKSKLAGMLVDPTNDQELKLALGTIFQKETTNEQKLNIQTECLKHFSFQIYQQNLKNLLLADTYEAGNTEPN